MDDKNYGKGDDFLFTSDIIQQIINKNLTVNINNFSNENLNNIYNVILKIFGIKLIILTNNGEKIDIRPLSDTNDNCNFYVFMLLSENKFSLITFDYNSSPVNSNGLRTNKLLCSFTSIFENPKNISNQDEYFKKIKDRKNER